MQGAPNSSIASSSSAKSPARLQGEWRNWAGMPSDALSVIFEKVGAIELLFSVETVCRSWRRLALEKTTWRKVDFTIGVWDFFERDVDLSKMAFTAIDRSSGLLEEFSIEHFCGDDILRYLAERSPKLKCLRVVSRELSPLLMPLQMLTEESMSALQMLQFSGYRITNKGLLAILDGCPDLNSLDLSQCFKIKMDEALKKRCTKIENLRLPNDSIAGYAFDSTFADTRRDLDHYALTKMCTDVENLRLPCNFTAGYPLDSTFTAMVSDLNYNDYDDYEEFRNADCEDYDALTNR